MIEVQEIGFKTVGTELRRGWPPADFTWQCYYMVSSSGVVVIHVKEIFFLGLARCNCN